MNTKKKIVLGLLFVSIICTALYICLIPHTVYVDHIKNNIFNDTITTHPLSWANMLIQAVKLFLIINIPNIIIVLRDFYKSGKGDVTGEKV